MFGYGILPEGPPLQLFAPKADETKLTEIGPKDAAICKQFCEEKRRNRQKSGSIENGQMKKLQDMY